MSWKAAAGHAGAKRQEINVAKKKFKISGPGAADFLAAPGGLDLPETDSSKGMGQTREDGLVNDPTRLEPDLEPEDPATARERTLDAGSPTKNAKDRKS
jgi:hypothetical protein